jgi:anti-anti-sigma factor
VTIGSPGPLAIDTQTRAGVTLLSLAGELDLAAEATVKGAVAAALAARPTAIIVDLGRLSFLDSTGVRCLIVARRDAAAAGVSLTVREAKGIVERVLTITGILPAFAHPEPVSPPQDYSVPGQPKAAAGGFLARLGRRAKRSPRN